MNNEIKEICRICEQNIHCQGKGCAFRSLGNEYCDEVDNANKLINDLQKQNTELKDNWNKLKEWLEEEIKYNENWYKPECKEYIGQKRYPDDTIDGFDYVLEKLQEIEGGINE